MGEGNGMMMNRRVIACLLAIWAALLPLLLAGCAGSMSATATARVAATIVSNRPTQPPQPLANLIRRVRRERQSQRGKAGRRRHIVAGQRTDVGTATRGFSFKKLFSPIGASSYVLSTDAAGTQNGAFSADTYVGDQSLPAEANADVTQGKASGGVAVYESNKLLNAKDGSLSPLSDGKHKLVLHISSKDAPKGVYKAFAVFDNKTLVWSPTASAK